MGGRLTATADFGLARITEHDPEFGKVTFETGRSVQFTFIRNTEKSQNFGSRYGQDIEPTGIYMLHKEDDGDAPTKWATGVMSFRKPLVLEATLSDRLYGASGWKARLTAATGKKKRALSSHLISLGFDGIVTVGSWGRGRSTQEILALRGSS
jgi:hypothetical protein